MEETKEAPLTDIQLQIPVEPKPTSFKDFQYADIKLPTQTEPKPITFGDAWKSQKQVYAQKFDDKKKAIGQKKDNVVTTFTKGYDTKLDNTLNKFIKPIDETGEKYANMSPEELEKYKKERPQKMAKLIFERGIIACKIILLVVLLIVAFVNADVSFISENPKTFLGEAIAVGASTAVATAIIGGTRFASAKTILNAMFIVFLVFFIIHMLMEFSGMNNEDESNTELAKNVKITTIVTASVVGLIALTMIPLAWRVWDFKNFKKNKITLSKYLLEFVSFGLLGGLPILMIAKNRKSKSAGKKFLIATGSLSGLYLVLQSGGYFSHTFGEMPEEPTFFKKSNALVHPMTI